MIALVVNGTVTRTAATPPEVWTRPNGSVVAGYHLRPDLWTTDGWLSVVDSGPAPTSTQIGTEVLVVGPAQVTRTWTGIADVPELVNAQTIRDQATAALQANRDFLAIASPTNAQVLVQVRALTQQNVKVIRQVLGLFDGTA